MAVSKRVRFEIFKRDGFRCGYCGRGVSDSVLHVDHVVPRAKGGGDEPENLITACESCNSGKSDVKLEERRYKKRSGDELEEHAAQIRGYIHASQEYERAKAELRDYIVAMWKTYIDEDGLPGSMVTRIERMSASHGMQSVIDAMWVTSNSGLYGKRAIAYFVGVMKNMSKEQA